MPKALPKAMPEALPEALPLPCIWTTTGTAVAGCVNRQHSEYGL
jgi:hypothetical protein